MLQTNDIDRNVALRAALYARVSTGRQAQAGTIHSQVAAIEQRAAEDGLAIEPELRFIDDGYSGSTLVRPALERLRDIAYGGGVDRLYLLCPDRLARHCAYQILLVDELQRCGVELVFVNCKLGETAEDKLQQQGLLVCKCCGYAYCGRHRGGGGADKHYCYYRCPGTEASRCGGRRICQNQSVRQEVLDQAVWNDVRALLADPGRVENELRRRIEGDNPDEQQRADQKLAAQIEKLRRGIARMIDAYGEGLVDKSEFEPRIKSAREQ